MNPHERIAHKILSLARLPVPTLPLNVVRGDPRSGEIPYYTTSAHPTKSDSDARVTLVNVVRGGDPSATFSIISVYFLVVNTNFIRRISSMEIIVLVLGIVGFIMSFVIVGIAPAILAILLGLVRLMMKKKPQHKLARIETIIGIVFAVIALIVGAYVYFAGVMDIDFVKIVRQDIQDFLGFFKRG